MYMLPIKRVELFGYAHLLAPLTLTATAKRVQIRVYVYVLNGKGQRSSQHAFLFSLTQTTTVKHVQIRDYVYALNGNGQKSSRHPFLFSLNIVTTVKRAQKQRAQKRVYMYILVTKRVQLFTTRISYSLSRPTPRCTRIIPFPSLRLPLISPFSLAQITMFTCVKRVYMYVCRWAAAQLFTTRTSLSSLHHINKVSLSVHARRLFHLLEWPNHYGYSQWAV